MRGASLWLGEQVGWCVWGGGVWRAVVHPVCWWHTRGTGSTSQVVKVWTDSVDVVSSWIRGGERVVRSRTPGRILSRMDSDAPKQRGNGWVCLSLDRHAQPPALFVTVQHCPQSPRILASLIQHRLCCCRAGGCNPHSVPKRPPGAVPRDLHGLAPLQPVPGRSQQRQCGQRVYCGQRAQQQPGSSRGIVCTNQHQQLWAAGGRRGPCQYCHGIVGRGW